MNIYFLNLLFLVLSFLTIKYRSELCNYFNLIDYPNKELGIHKSKKILFGGIFLFLGIIYSYVLNVNSEYDRIYFSPILLISFFLISLTDDIKNLNAYTRLVLTFFAALISVYFDPSLRINSLYIFFTDSIFFNTNIYFNYIFTILCILLLVNAFNFTDGIDGLASCIGISYFIYLITKNNIIFFQYFIFIIFVLIFLYMNFKKNVLLGDSGNYLISISIAIIIIKINYYYPQSFYAEEIFLLLMIPGIDMLRLFIVRIKKGLNPFYGDHNHLHHKLFFKYGSKITLTVYLLIMNIPLYIFFYFRELLAFLVIIKLFTYFGLLKFLSLSK